MSLGIDSVVGAGFYHIRNMVKPLAWLQESTVWRAPTYAVPKEDDTNLPHASDVNSVVGIYSRPILVVVGSKT